jgi:hypothetical protein
MKLTSKHYSNQIFKKVSFYNGGLAEWWTKKLLSGVILITATLPMLWQEGAVS